MKIYKHFLIGIVVVFTIIIFILLHPDTIIAGSNNNYSRQKIFQYMRSTSFINSSYESDGGVNYGLKQGNIKNTKIAFLLTLSPWIVAPIVAYAANNLGKGLGLNEKTSGGMAAAIGLPILFLGTIPAHVYVKHTFAKIALTLFVKCGSTAVMAYGFRMMGENAFSESDDEVGIFPPLLFTLGLLSTAGSIFYELGDIPQSAKKYNDNILKNRFSIHFCKSADGVGVKF